MKWIIACLVFAFAMALPPVTVAAQEMPTHGPFWTCAWCKDFSIGTRPRGQEIGGYDLWMRMPESEPKGIGKEFRIPPIPFTGEENGRLVISYQPDGLVAPNARWVAFSQKICRGYAVAFVLKRGGKEGFTPLPKLVSELAWEKFFEENPDQIAHRGEMDGITRLAESSICDLVAWEPDSSGVWFSLRAGDRSAAGIYHWYFLWDTKTEKVVIPERVKTINRFAAARWNASDTILSKEANAAEELHTVFLAEFRLRLADPNRVIEKTTFLLEARALHDRYRRADGQRAAKGLRMSDTNSIIDGQRELLFRASLKEGSVATSADP